MSDLIETWKNDFRAFVNSLNLDRDDYKTMMEYIDEISAVQPDRDVIDDCLYHIYKNISVHTATGGVIAIRYYMEKLYEDIYGEGERPWWMT